MDPIHILPLSEVFLNHHSKILDGPMKEWKKHFPPVLLLTGPSGIGKRSLGYFLGQWILCENPQLLRPCQTCPSCLRALENHWTEFTEIAPVDGEESQTLKIDQFRGLKSSSGFGTTDSRKRVILIPNADRMTIQAANSILKILEEPPSGWIFILTANDATLLLPTLISRCQKLRLQPLTESDISTLLQEKGVTSKEIQTLAAKSAHGSLGRALAWVQEETWKQRSLIFDFLRSPDQHLTLLVDWASQENANFEIFLDIFEHLTSDLVRWSVQSDQFSAETYPWVYSDGRKEIVFHTQKMTQVSIKAARKFWIGRAERFAQARQEAKTPMNRKILIQDLLIPWLL